jgi:acetylornithine deacetylase/succinyl-diaminopimelate desuccinylase-like protein
MGLKNLWLFSWEKNMLDSAINFARTHREIHLAGLCNWLRIPSVSTLPEHAPDVHSAAAFAADFLSRMGMEQVGVRKTAGHPIAYGEWLHAAGAPTLLIYGHFDVQPIDPAEEWTHPPFEPVVDNENLYARGASDDKGQAFAVLAALESYFKTSGKLPINVKVLLEGEEEVPSPNLAPYIREHAGELAADAILIADQDMLDPQHPVVMWGVRGQVYAEVEVRGPAHDLHSGTFGGSVDNPFNVLVRLLARLQDAQSRKVLIPGFYDRVDELTPEERALIAQAPINDQVGLYLTGALALGGEEGYPLAERISVRPTLEVHGIAGGFTGEGSKTVIPSKAMAKVSMRLVPNQDPEEIAVLFEEYIRRQCPPTVSLDVRILGKAHPVKIDYKSPAVRAAAEAYQKGFGHSPVYLSGGGSLPIVHDMIETLSKPGSKIPVVMIGFGLPDDRTHAPNEKFSIPHFYRGIETVIHYLNLFAKL